MFCNKCGAETQVGMKFCKKCGNPLQVQANAAQNSNPEVNYAQNGNQQVNYAQNGNQQVNYAQNSYAQNTNPGVNYAQPGQVSQKITTAKSGNVFTKIAGLSMKVKCAIVAAVVVVAAGGAVAYAFLGSDQVVIAKSFANTAEVMQEEFIGNLEMLPLYSHFSDMEEQTYHMDLEVETAYVTVGAEMMYNFADKQFEAITEAMGMEIATVKVSEEHLTLEGDVLNDTYGVNVSEVLEDYMNVADLEELQTAEEELMKVAKEIAADEMVAYFADLDIEKSKDTVKIDGDKVDATTYEFEVEGKDVGSLVEDIYKAVMKTDEADTYIDVLEGLSEAYAEMGVYIDLEGSMDSVIDELVWELEYMDDMDVVLYIYKDIIVKIEMENDYSEVCVELGSVENVLEEIILSADGYEVLTFVNTFEKDEYVLELINEWGETVGFTCDVSDDKNNAAFYVDYEEYTFTMTEPSKDELYLEIEYSDYWGDVTTISLESAKGSISGYTFDQDTDYEDIIEMVEDYGDDFLTMMLDESFFYNLYYNFY